MDGGFFQSFDRKGNSRKLGDLESVDKTFDKEQNHKNS